MNVVGRPIGLLLGQGEQADSCAAADLVAKIEPFARLLADPVRQQLRDTGGKPVIFDRCNWKKAIRHDCRRDMQRWRVETTIDRLKGVRRVATRCDEPARTVVDTVALAATDMSWL